MAKPKLELNNFNAVLWNKIVPKSHLPILAGVLVARVGCTYASAMRHLYHQHKLKRMLVNHPAKSYQNVKVGMSSQEESDFNDLVRRLINSSASSLIEFGGDMSVPHQP